MPQSEREERRNRVHLNRGVFYREKRASSFFGSDKLGILKKHLIDNRDNLIDFVDGWSDKTGIPACRFAAWIGISSSKFPDWKRRFGKVIKHNALVPRNDWLTEDEKESVLPASLPESILLRC